jgi:hypothetical protein
MAQAASPLLCLVFLDAPPLLAPGALSRTQEPPRRGPIRLVSWGAERAFREAAKVFGELLGPVRSRERPLRLATTASATPARGRFPRTRRPGSRRRPRARGAEGPAGERGENPSQLPLGTRGACPQENAAFVPAVLPPSPCGDGNSLGSFLVCRRWSEPYVAAAAAATASGAGRWPCRTADAR